MPSRAPLPAVTRLTVLLVVLALVAAACDGRDTGPDGLAVDLDQAIGEATERAYAAAHRTRHSSAHEMAMFVLSVRGEFERPGVLGVAINATEFVLFPDNIGDLTVTLLGGRSAIERAVLVHEAGHLLCLVNITYESATDHEDPDNPHHSVHRGSVMHWVIPNDAISKFTGPPPSQFHADDLADLEGLRAGRY